MPLSDTSESKCNFIVLCSGPDIFRVAFRQPKYKSSRSFLPINVKTNLSSGIRLKKQICIISIFSFRVLELFQSNARKPNLLSHLTSVFVVHLSVLVASDLWDDCNRKNIVFLSFLSSLWLNILLLSGIWLQFIGNRSKVSTFQVSHPQILLSFKKSQGTYFHIYTEHSLGCNLGWGGLAFF